MSVFVEVRGEHKIPNGAFYHHPVKGNLRIMTVTWAYVRRIDVQHEMFVMEGHCSYRGKKIKQLLNPQTAYWLEFEKELLEQALDEAEKWGIK